MLGVILTALALALAIFAGLACLLCRFRQGCVIFAVAMTLFALPMGDVSRIMPKELVDLATNTTDVVWRRAVTENPQLVALMTTVVSWTNYTTTTPWVHSTPVNQCEAFEKKSCWTIPGYLTYTYGMLSDNETYVVYYMQPTFIGKIMFGYETPISGDSMAHFSQVTSLATMELGCRLEHVATGCYADIRSYILAEEARRPQNALINAITMLWKSCSGFAFGRLCALIVFRLFLIQYVIPGKTMICWALFTAYINFSVYDPLHPNLFTTFCRYWFFAEIGSWVMYCIPAWWFFFATSWYARHCPGSDFNKIGLCGATYMIVGAAITSFFSGKFTFTRAAKGQIACAWASSTGVVAKLVSRTERVKAECAYLAEGGGRHKNKKQKQFKYTDRKGRTTWVTQQEYQAAKQAEYEFDAVNQLDADTNADAVAAALSGADEQTMRRLTGGLYNRQIGYLSEANRIRVAQWILGNELGSDYLHLDHCHPSPPVVEGNKGPEGTVVTQNADVVPKGTPAPNIGQQNQETAKLVQDQLDAYEREQKRLLERLRELEESQKPAAAPATSLSNRQFKKAKQQQQQLPRQHKAESYINKQDSSNIKNAPMIVKINDGEGTLVMQGCLEGAVIQDTNFVRFAVHVPYHGGDEKQLPWVTTAKQPTQVPSGTRITCAIGPSTVTVTLRNIVTTRAEMHHAYLCCEVSNDTWNVHKAAFEYTRSPPASAKPELGAQVCVVTQSVYGLISQFGTVEAVNLTSMHHNADVVFNPDLPAAQRGEGSSGSQVYIMCGRAYKFYGYHDGGVTNKYNVAVAPAPFRVTADMF